MRRRVWPLLLLASVPLAFTITSQGQDMPLDITEQALSELRELRAERKFLDLPGEPAQRERRRLEPLINGLLDRLLAGVQSHPQAGWVIGQMESTVEAFHLEDTEARERCLAYIERIFKVLRIPNDGGAFRKYMIFW